MVNHQTEKALVIQSSDVPPFIYELHEIMQAMGLAPTMEIFEILAGDLSRLAGRSPAWTKKYIHSVYHARITPSSQLEHAISTLAQTIDGAPTGVAGSVWVKVLAQSTIPEGVLIPASAKAMKCVRPGCPVWFVRVSARQTFHDPQCREQAKREKRKRGKK